MKTWLKPDVSKTAVPRRSLPSFSALSSFLVCLTPGFVHAFQVYPLLAAVGAGVACSAYAGTRCLYKSPEVL